MKQYTVQITDKALADMEEIYTYIAEQLLAPENAIGQYNRIAEAIQNLNVFPERVRIKSNFLIKRCVVLLCIKTDGSSQEAQVRMFPFAFALF